MDEDTVTEYRENLDSYGSYANAASDNRQILNDLTRDYMDTLFDGTLRDDLLRYTEERFETEYDLDASIASVRDEVEAIVEHILGDASIEPEDADSAAAEALQEIADTSGFEHWVKQ